MNPKTILLGWNKPWVQILADWLWTCPELLRRRLVVVPTRESGRRLQEVLLQKANEEGVSAILGPQLATPEDFFRPEEPMPDSVRWAGWVQVLRNVQDAAVENLFPSGTSNKDDGWRVGVARQIELAREQLVSINSCFEEVARRLPEERERWLELSDLEKRVMDLWAKWGFTDPVSAKRLRAETPTRPHGIEEIIIAGIADPTWLSVEAWRRLADGGVAITVLVGAPVALGQSFDGWGRPKPEFWIDRNQYATPEPTKTFVAADAAGLAEAVVHSCAKKSNKQVAVGICDSKFASAVARRFQDAGWATFDPKGVPVSKDGWPELLEAFAGALENPHEYAAVVRLVKHPILWREWFKEGDPMEVFTALGRWEKKHGGSNMARAMDHLSNQAGSNELRQSGAFFREVYGFLLEVLAGKVSALEKKLTQWLEADSPELAELMASETNGWKVLNLKTFSLPLRLRWLAATLSNFCRPPDTSTAALALQGWLELFYEPAPDLVLAGMHEGSVPETPESNSLISEALREKLSLRDRKSRLAREIFLYTAMVEGRRENGSVTVVTAQANPQSDPCRPSRVLLHAEPSRLPARVLLLIKEKPDVPLEATPPWARGDWRLRLLREAKPNRTWGHLSPSTLKAYLDCPTRFYFYKVLGWEEFHPFEQELDAKGFGDLVHEVFRRWAGDKEAREFTDPRRLRDCWLDLLRQQVQLQFGPSLPPLLQLQVMSAEERLRVLSEKQAQQRQEGWHIIAFEKDYKDTLLLAGLPVEMRIDRIDQHDDGKRFRVIDYKTGREGLKPRKTHLRTWPQESRPAPLGELLEIRGRSYGWSDLQLPIYACTVRKELNLELVPQACYALLPEAVSETGFVAFDEMEKYLGNAMQWAEEAARRIVAGVFWPPSPEVKYDLFATIAPEGLQQALGPEWAEFLAGQKNEQEGVSR